MEPPGGSKGPVQGQPLRLKLRQTFFLRLTGAHGLFSTSFRHSWECTGRGGVLQGGQIMEKQLDLGPLSLPGALGISPTLPIPSFLFSSLLEKLRDEAGEALQELGAGTQLHLGRHPMHSVSLT